MYSAFLADVTCRNALAVSSNSIRVCSPSSRNTRNIAPKIDDDFANSSKASLNPRNDLLKFVKKLINFPRPVTVSAIDCASSSKFLVVSSIDPLDDPIEMIALTRDAPITSLASSAATLSRANLPSTVSASAAAKPAKLRRSSPKILLKSFVARRSLSSPTPNL